MFPFRSTQTIGRALFPSFSMLCRNPFQVSSYSVRSFAKKAKEETGIKIDFKVPFETYKCEGPANYAYTTKEELLGFFKVMSRIRRMEVTADNLYKQKLIRGFCHLYNGQEAIAAGVEASITKDDFVITAYRDHGLMVARGSDPKSVLGELMMKATGCSKGKGGSMHMFDLANNFWGGHGIVGAQCPLGAGLAFTQKYRGTNHVSLTFYGDGAANQGQLYEAFNMAALWKLPCIFICENNQYAMGTAVSRAAADTNYYARAHFIPGIKVDAMNVLAVRSATQYVVDYVRAGNGPFVMEMNTYRYVGHSMSDPGTTYRTRDEVAQIRAERDPIDKVKHWLLDLQLSTEDELKAIEADIRREIDEAVDWCRQQPDPDPKELFTDVYLETVPVRAVELPQSFKP
jgi:pyruvate dehydrogenase E1 component alpha subunit